MSFFGGQPRSSFGGPNRSFLVQSMSERLVTAAASPTARNILYLLAVAVVVITVILIVDNFFPFLPASPFSRTSSQARAVKKFWKDSSVSAENMIVPASDSPTVRPDIYTMSVQFAIGDSRTPSLGQFRHILHRGNNPCSLSIGKAGPTGHVGVRAADLAANTEKVYTELGLPSVMNPGLFLDKYKNDMHVFVHTRGKEDGNDVLWLESMTVEDLPLNTPITVGVVCNGKNFEVYVNCRLYSTLLLKGTPYLPIAMNQWFGRYCAFPMYGVIQNLQLWDTALGSSDYMSMCRTMDPIDIPKACAAT